MERKENTRCGRKFKLEAVRVAAIGERPKAQLSDYSKYSRSTHSAWL